MTKSATTVSVHYVERVDFSFAPWTWPFAVERRAAIDAFFRREQDANPALWNGRLLLLRDHRVAGATMSGRFFETDYASLLAALAWDAMEEAVRACFPAAAILAADGAVILGEMAAHTRNAGQVLLPSGSVERGDVVGDRVGLFGALRREIEEETGLAPSTLDPDAGWYAVGVGPRLPMIKVMRAREPAEALRRRIAAALSAQSRPELRAVMVARGPSDLNDLSERMPLWVTAFLQQIWRQKVC